MECDQTDELTRYVCELDADQLLTGELFVKHFETYKNDCPTRWNNLPRLLTSFSGQERKYFNVLIQNLFAKNICF